MQELIDWIKSVGMDRLVWGTDVDLTLIEKNANPNLVEPPPGLEEDCRRIDALTGNRFFIITGRELPYIDQLFPNTCFKASCEYGNVVRLDAADGPKDINPRPQWDLVEQAMEKILLQFPGMVLRKKPFMRTIHYSHAPALQDPAVREAVEKDLLALLKAHDQITGHSLTLVDGGQVFDMGPGGLDKGWAYEHLLQYAAGLYRGSEPLIPVYFGDSPGDLPAARVAQAHGGVFVAVGSDRRVTDVADFVLRDPAECRALIRAISQPLPAPVPKGPELP